MMKRRFVLWAVFCVLVVSCAGNRAEPFSQSGAGETPAGGLSAVTVGGPLRPVPESDAVALAAADPAPVDLPLFLDSVAELERAGSFFPGLGLIESGEREGAGDYAGAVFAVYKDLSYAFAYNRIPRAEVDEGIGNLVDIKDSSGNRALEAAVQSAAVAVRAFSVGDWAEAAVLLAEKKPHFDEPDSFYQWMLLVSALESGNASHAVISAYGAIRGRYAKFPEYWYRGARAFKDERAVLYAEQCINVNPENPFAAECREIIASFIGLDFGADDLLSKAEIEDCIRRSVSGENPEILSALFPLMNLPDNSYTLYALGALKSLASVPAFNVFFQRQAALCSGRLAERLSYLTRG